MSRMAAAHNAVVIDDVIPAHTGKGADFRLAEMAYGDYPGPLPHGRDPRGGLAAAAGRPEGRDAVNLPPAVVDALQGQATTSSASCSG